MKISIALASYNGAAYILTQLMSCLAQTRPPDEIVVCDDRSSDKTREIVERFAAFASCPVQLHHNSQNLGYSRNFEKALSLCTGDIVFLSDQDDFWLPNKIARVLETFESEPETFLVVNDMMIADYNLLPGRHTQLQNTLSAGQRACEFYAGCCMAIRRSFLELVLPLPDSVFAHDNWINYLALALDVRRLIPEPLQMYRRHGENASSWLLSSPQGVSQLQLFRAHGLVSAEPGWRDEIERYRIIGERLTARQASLERLGIQNRQQEALRRLDRIRANLEARLALTSRRRLARWPSVLSLLRNGGYADFAGWKSAAKDLIRP
jgi:glycosyltransferase involved in cell wall biosynthesis